MATTMIPVDGTFIRTTFPEAWEDILMDLGDDDSFYTSEHGVLHWVDANQGDFWWDGEHNAWILTEH